MFGACACSSPAWVTSHQSARRYQICFPSNLSVWPLTPSPWRGRKPETAITLLPAPFPPASVSEPSPSLDASTPVLSLNSQINKLPVSCSQIPSDPSWHLSTAETQQGRTRSSWSTTQSQLGVIDSTILRRSNAPVAWLIWFVITCHSVRGSRGGVDVQLQVGYS